MSTARAALGFINSEDPAIRIAREVGTVINNIEVLNQLVLVGLYERDPDAKTAGGIIRGHAVGQDDEYQSKVGLVLKVGHRAFKDEPHGQYPVLFYGFSLKIGDWVGFKASDGIGLQVGSKVCRLIPDVHIKLRLKTPDDIF